MDNDLLSDVKFVVEDRPIHAHKVRHLLLFITKMSLRFVINIDSVSSKSLFSQFVDW